MVAIYREEEYKDVIKRIKQKIAELQIEMGETLSEEEIEKIVSLMNKLRGMGLNSEYLISQAEKLYNKYGADLVNHADEAISEAVSDAVNGAAKGFFQSVKDSVKEFWNSLFS